MSDRFIHSLGHGFGIEVHESPDISFSTKGVFKAGMVVTIELGVYVLGKYGIRIEDDVLVTAEKPKALSKFRKELIIIGLCCIVTLKGVFSFKIKINNHKYALF